MAYEKELNAMIEACRKASDKIMEVYRREFKINYKSDHSPVTEADLASNQIIRNILSQFTEIGWLSEEDQDNPERFNKSMLFIIDPLDGTADFINHDDSFGINIALVKDHEPVVSVIGVPAKNSYAYAVKDEGSYYVHDSLKEKLHVSDKTENLIMVQSLTHNLKCEEELIQRHQDKIKETIFLGASTKSIAIASGKADCSIRFTDQTKEWDLCAPQLILEEAGGMMRDLHLRPFRYNRTDVYNRDGYCMLNRSGNFFLLD